ncbi:Na(+)/H(+) antiporter subunit C [Streptomyces sp. F63]|uniref:Na(+)/H(+) antiporter subunit C n=1 Tax=Streptomyces sp. F63 TaxID=2824887 RepID=UPI001B3886E7|nr:Na(+)/H(+) antiporter subunit C [Streptomyces sp. F63]MBQ0986992.1 Na(+)/H(+) antiporter subunit C [Streptomyces sp. F63]
MRTPDVVLAVVVGGLYAVGFLLMMQRSLMRIVLGFILLGHGTNLLLLSAGRPGEPPLTDGSSAEPGRYADPLPQAMALTSVVITFGLTAFLLALAYRSWWLTGHDEVQDDVEDRRIGTARERAGPAEPETGARTSGARSSEAGGQDGTGGAGNRPAEGNP